MEIKGNVGLTGTYSAAFTTLGKFLDVQGGTVTLSGNNSATAGGVRVGTTAAGVLNINNANALGTGTLQINGVALATIDNTSAGGALRR